MCTALTCHVLLPQDVYGFDMSPIAAEVLKGEARNANVHVVPAADIVTNEVLLKVCVGKGERGTERGRYAGG